MTTTTTMTMRMMTMIMHYTSRALYPQNPKSALQIIIYKLHWTVIHIIWIPNMVHENKLTDRFSFLKSGLKLSFRNTSAFLCMNQSTKEGSHTTRRVHRNVKIKLIPGLSPFWHFVRQKGVPHWRFSLSDNPLYHLTHDKMGVGTLPRLGALPHTTLLFTMLEYSFSFQSF